MCSRPHRVRSVLGSGTLGPAEISTSLRMRRSTSPNAAGGPTLIDARDVATLNIHFGFIRLDAIGRNRRRRMRIRSNPYRGWGAGRICALARRLGQIGRPGQLLRPSTAGGARRGRAPRDRGDEVIRQGLPGRFVDL